MMWASMCMVAGKPLTGMGFWFYGVGPMARSFVVREGKLVELGGSEDATLSGLQVRSRGDLRHIAHSLPSKGQDPLVDKFAPRFGPEGVPVFHTKREIEEFAAATGRPYGG